MDACMYTALYILRKLYTRTSILCVYIVRIYLYIYMYVYKYISESGSMP